MKRVHSLESRCLLEIFKSKKKCLNPQLWSDWRLNIVNEFSNILKTRELVDKKLINDFLECIILDVSIVKIKTAVKIKESIKAIINKRHFFLEYRREAASVSFESAYLIICYYIK
jgi:hypothetical protein